MSIVEGVQGLVSFLGYRINILRMVRETTTSFVNEIGQCRNMNSKLRVGLLLDSLFLPGWAFTAIKRMIASNCAEVALIVLNHPRVKSSSFLSMIWQTRKSSLYHVFNAIDERLFLRNANALTKFDSSALFSATPIFEVEPIEEDDEQYFSAPVLEQINSHRLDILVKFGFGKLGKDIFSCAKYGIWTYRWGDQRKIEEGLTGFWEVARGWPETGAALQQYGVDTEHHKTLCESWFFTYPYSPARSRNYILWAASSFLPREVERLHRCGPEEFFQKIEKNHSHTNPRLLQSNNVPSNFAILWVMAKLVGRNLLEIYRRIFCRERWELLFNFGESTKKKFSAFRKIIPPKDRFWADPHVIYRESNYYLFVEEYPYQTKRGHLSVIEMDAYGNYKQPIPILQKDYHLSFPFVFEWLGHYYLIPESSTNKTIDLYECVKFPDQWRHKITLMKDVTAVDTTAFCFDGKWWLFTGMAEQETAAPQVELFLFYSDELITDQWNAHPMNPIVSDVKRARAAGRILAKDGKLFRPSQDCSKTYGYGFDLNAIVVLSETEYAERTVTTVRPNWEKGVIATHTYASQENLTVIDALTRPYKWAKTAGL